MTMFIHASSFVISVDGIRTYPLTSSKSSGQILPSSLGYGDSKT